MAGPLYERDAEVMMIGNVLELTPPRTLSRSEAEEGIDIIDRAMTDVTWGVVSDADVAPFMMW
jgi:4-aminobutyrate aminotransferase